METLPFISNNTCIKFRRRSNEDGHNYIYMQVPVMGAYGCSAHLGRNKTSHTQINLGKGCVIHRTILHEVMHALGLFHEQSRHDAANYVHINKARINIGGPARDGIHMGEELRRGTGGQDRRGVAGERDGHGGGVDSEAGGGGEACQEDQAATVQGQDRECKCLYACVVVIRLMEWWV